MGNAVRKIAEEIRKGRDLEIYLPQLGSRIAESYYRSALINFSMNYVITYEMMADKKPEDEICEYLDILREETEKNLLSGFDGKVLERSVERIHELRSEIISRMEALTAYTDTLEIYEYVLNRLEPGFLPELPEEDLETFAGEIYQYLFDTTDNVVINEKIKEVVSQLPVRLTRQKFYDLLRDSLSIYKGSDASSLELYEYMIRTGAMLYHPEGMDRYYKNLKETADLMAGLDFEHLSKEQFDAATEALQQAVRFIGENVDDYVYLAMAVNNLYTLILTAPYGESAFVGKEQAEKIIRATCRAFAGEYPSVTEYLDEVESDLVLLEGRLEEQLEQNEPLEAALEEARQHGNLIDSLMLRPLYDSLRLCTLLSSDSFFADIEKKGPEGSVTEERLEEVTHRLLNDFAAAFERQSRPVRRAVMAGTLSRMPVFFTGRQEVMDYIQNALLSCLNPAELSGSIGMLRGIMGNFYD